MWSEGLFPFLRGAATGLDAGAVCAPAKAAASGWFDCASLLRAQQRKLCVVPTVGAR